jgi:hypothetical protein
MKSKLSLIVTISLAIALIEIPAVVSSQDQQGNDSRLAPLVEANVIAVHAFQMLLAKTSGKGDRSCFSSGDLTDAQLMALSQSVSNIKTAETQSTPRLRRELSLILGSTQ